MAAIRHEIAIAAPPQHVWDVIRDVGAVHDRLLPGRVVATELQGPQRLLTFPDGHKIRELIVSIDNETHRVAYSVIEGARPALDYHHATFEVHPEGEHARLIWTTDVLPDSAAPEIRIRTRFGIAEMKHTIEAAAPGKPHD